MSLTNTLVYKLNEYDVLFGRGAPSCFYIGNMHFRELMRPKRAAFMGTGRHRVKHEIAEEILAMIAAKNGRFLRRIQSPKAKAKSMGLPEDTEIFAVVCQHDALRKIKQALREDDSKMSARQRDKVVAATNADVKSHQDKERLSVVSDTSKPEAFTVSNETLPREELVPQAPEHGTMPTYLTHQNPGSAIGYQQLDNAIAFQQCLSRAREEQYRRLLRQAQEETLRREQMNVLAAQRFAMAYSRDQALLAVQSTLYHPRSAAQATTFGAPAYQGSFM